MLRAQGQRPDAGNRVAGMSLILDVLDRILDKGLVVEPWVRVSAPGLDLSARGAQLLITSMHIYLDYGEPLAEPSDARSVLPIIREPVEDWPAVDDAYPFERPRQPIDWFRDGRRAAQ